MKDLGSVNKEKKVYEKPIFSCNELKMDKFLAVSGVIPDLPENPTSKQVLDVVDCCLQIDNYNPNNPTQNTDEILNDLLDDCKHVIRDNECTDGCWLPSSVTNMKIKKSSTGDYYWESCEGGGWW